MRISRTLFLAVLVLAGIAVACGDNPGDPCLGADCVAVPYPKSLWEPDSLMQQLLVAYQRREIDRYAELLARDFVFRFQEGDIDLLGPELVFGQDSLSTDAMFGSSDVVDVRLSMTWLPPTQELWEGEPMMRVVLSDLLLEVEQSNNVTLRVQGQTQHFYFRLGKPELGEDPDRYYLRAWRDIGSGGSTGLAASVENETWGAIKLRFLPAPEASRGLREP